MVPFKHFGFWILSGALLGGTAFSLLAYIVASQDMGGATFFGSRAFIDQLSIVSLGFVIGFVLGGAGSTLVGAGSFSDGEFI